MAVTGSSGLIGTALTALLTTSGHRVIPLVRRLPRAGRALLAAGRPGRGAAGRGGRGDPPGRGLDRRPVHRRAQERDPRQPDPAHPPPGRAGRRHPRPAGVRHGLGHRHLRPGPGQRGPDRGQPARRRVPGRRGGRLGGRHHPGRRGGHPHGPGQDRHRADPARRHAAAAQPAVRGRARRPARHGKQWLAWIALDDLLDIYLRAVLDPAYPARSTRSRRSRCGTRTTPGRWPRCCAAPRCCRCRVSAPGCCSATRAPGKSPRPASTSCPSG